MGQWRANAVLCAGCVLWEEEIIRLVKHSRFSCSEKSDRRTDYDWLGSRASSAASPHLWVFHTISHRHCVFWCKRL